MPAKDIFHDCVKNSLVKAGWTITHDPFRIRLTRKNLFVDLGAERLIAADRGTEKIAVEIKSFTQASDIKDLEDALSVYKTVFEEEAGQILLEDKLIRLITFDPEQEVISQWIPT